MNPEFPNSNGSNNLDNGYLAHLAESNDYIQEDSNNNLESAHYSEFSYFEGEGNVRIDHEGSLSYCFHNNDEINFDGQKVSKHNIEYSGSDFLEEDGRNSKIEEWDIDNLTMCWEYAIESYKQYHGIISVPKKEDLKTYENSSNTNENLGNVYILKSDKSSLVVNESKSKDLVIESGNYVVRNANKKRLRSGSCKNEIQIGEKLQDSIVSTGSFSKNVEHKHEVSEKELQLENSDEIDTGRLEKKAYDFKSSSFKNDKEVVQNKKSFRDHQKITQNISVLDLEYDLNKQESPKKMDSLQNNVPEPLKSKRETKFNKQDQNPLCDNSVNSTLDWLHINEDSNSKRSKSKSIIEKPFKLDSLKLFDSIQVSLPPMPKNEDELVKYLCSSMYYMGYYKGMYEERSKKSKKKKDAKKRTKKI
ncbi:hypothetical protein BB560_003654 [Smittium megazygosporum]|uniref:Survival motor neuron Tudor domain-containing protein n=1 Tax=Smittium megazygosporum TaxID=133381 RepID=A0A2T9ZBC1_9FUNG|nr:hypothetical protein BB560_003654 [Smittium megazygosporum]